jgi:hypothetical protein
MNRKLHNTVTALFATSGLLALSLMAANPLPQEVALKPAPTTQLARLEAATARLETQARNLAGLGAEAATLAAVAEAIDQAEVAKAEAAPARPARRSHRGRQSVAMPFFSFFPKG